jgi:hypothetical protein
MSACMLSAFVAILFSGILAQAERSAVADFDRQTD